MSLPRRVCCPRRLLPLLLLLASPCAALDAPPPVSGRPSGAGTPDAPPPLPRRPNPLLEGVRRAVMPPLKLFSEAPPITRSWVSLSVLMALLSSSKVLDLRSVCFSERAVMQHGEWWRLLVNFFYMGDAVKSVFFWFQLHHFWECLKVLELVKYRWEPGDFIKMIVCNACFLLLLKQFFPAMIFLGSPMVMAFVYMYSREYEVQVMNLLGFFQIRCGWLPFAQMLQDLLQAGDIGPNLLGLVSGHTYFYLMEVRSRLLLPERLTLDDVLNLVIRGKHLGAADEALETPPAKKDEAVVEDGSSAAEPAEDGEAPEAAEAGQATSPDN